ncbi:hypothetical protein AQUCO_04000133v1 [Aquilegia coerulea]|uniref:Splicing factor Cactin C-terminal domain-containing protein n=1 Tax=Aquilegia coerulea TaxID=218851 RepID=A0A2G5CRA1_AQUCA|nr:hypothetical protein AQUCO_04000133v1 [Aquilegia coerulea]
MEKKCAADQHWRHQESTIGKYDALLGSGAEEVNRDSQVYYWSDKYHPRKPKYLNRVLTGYEWNKYNRTHHDHDSPPPKAVQGYRFTILYPDLLDISKTPQYIIEKDGSNVETCIIIFCAGPPYQDIAFRIVNKEWRKSKKDGFKMYVRSWNFASVFQLTTVSVSLPQVKFCKGACLNNECYV